MISPVLLGGFRNDKCGMINQFCSGYLPWCVFFFLRAKGRETGGKGAQVR